jgi:site-specific recombinase XerD
VEDVGPIAHLLPSWTRHLRAENKAPRTIDGYLRAAGSYDEWLTAHGVRDLNVIGKATVQEYLVDLQDRGLRPSSVATAYRCLQQLFRWLVDEDEIAVSPMASMRPPKVPKDPPPVVDGADLAKLLKACEGRDFADRRDMAIVSVLVDTGVRLAELAGMRVGDINLDLDVAIVLGKGRRLRSVPFGKKTATAVDRYLRARARHPDRELESLWLSSKGRLTDSGVRQMLERRCTSAGIPAINPHRFRHTFAHQWLADGGQEGDLMQIAGWSSREMVGRYGASAAAERARQAHRKLSPRDKL